MTISLFNYSKQNLVPVVQEKVRDLESAQISGMILTIGVLAIGILFFTLMVYKYQFILNKPLPLIHYGVTLGVPCAIATMFTGFTIGATYFLHRKRPIEELQRQFPNHSRLNSKMPIFQFNRLYYKSSK